MARPCPLAVIVNLHLRPFARIMIHAIAGQLSRDDPISHVDGACGEWLEELRGHKASLVPQFLLLHADDVVRLSSTRDRHICERTAVVQSTHSRPSCDQLLPELRGRLSLTASDWDRG